MDINVNIESLNAGGISSYKKEIDSAIASALEAGEAALAAVGGSATNVGAALSNSLLEVNKTEYDKAVATIDNMIANVGTLNKAYKEEEDELVRAINEFANKVGSN